ncbi:LysM peptidoglycan-binding domain-containing protein [Rhodobacteraceae bacterium DSL-40]|uniref:LysM peptidoglycan-binding domain-containing protein n=1 Tax=Amaricoccus sp. B4 TaxID=3368557 RepID=UPI000DAB400E
MEEKTESRTRRKLAAGAVSAAILLLLIYATRPEPLVPQVPELDAETGAPLADAAPGAGPGELADAGSAAPQAEGFEPAAARPPASGPAFDIVRVEPDGSAVVAGTARPDAKVTIYADGMPLAAVEADDDGSFVAIFRADPARGAQALTMDAETADGTRTASDEVVMLLPDASSTAAAPPAAGDAPAAQAPAPSVAATAILRPGSVDVLPVARPAAMAAPIDTDQVSLGSISYTQSGEIELQGAGPRGTGLRVYVDNRLVQQGDVGGNGRWVLRLADIDQGLYRLRIDQVGADGRVASRVETPFQRDFPEGPRPRPGRTLPGMQPGVLATVQPGGTLWTLARSYYGSGVLYAQIFTANQELIRDPDLIYPGQVLSIPGLDETN